MQSRGLAERDIDKMIQNTKRVFNLVRGNISDENCRTIIDSLCKASSGAPDYRRDDITPLLMNAYYHRVILNEKMYPEQALDAAEKFLALGELDEDSSYYRFYNRFHLKITRVKPELEQSIRDKIFADINEKATVNLEAALKAGKEFLARCPDKNKTDKRYNDVTKMMLDINVKLVHVRQEARRRSAEADARAASIFEIPAVRLYRSVNEVRPLVPRTPHPITRSLNEKRSRRVAKSNIETSTMSKNNKTPGKK